MQRRFQDRVQIVTDSIDDIEHVVQGSHFSIYFGVAILQYTVGFEIEPDLKRVAAAAQNEGVTKSQEAQERKRLEEEKKLVQEFLGRLSAGTILKMS